MNYMSMLGIGINPSMFFLVRIGAALLLHSYVSSFASVLLLFVFFLMRTTVVILFKRKLTNLFTCHEWKTVIVWYGITASHFEVTSQKQASTSTWFT